MSASRTEKELQKILQAAVSAGLVIDEACSVYSANDELFQKSDNRGHAEGARGEFIATIKGNFRDSKKISSSKKPDISQTPIDIQLTYVVTLLFHRPM